MTPMHIVSLAIGAAGAAAAYLAGVDPNDSALWHTISGVAAALVPVFAMTVEAYKGKASGGGAAS